MKFNPYFLAETLDDAMRDIMKSIIENGIKITPSKGKALELSGILIEILNPRARLSRTETRGKPFSCLGELSWYLAKSNDLEFISYYIKRYSEFSDDGYIHGGYGPRIFNWRDLNQLDNIIKILNLKPFSRQAVIQIFEASDIAEKFKDVPCTCTLQFFLRQDKLEMITHMRSNDIYLGFPHDVFSFTMIQEILARTLSVEIGSYKHFVGSIHLYEKNLSSVEDFLNEGWQSTITHMPPMPCEDPWISIKSFLAAEEKIRTTGSVGIEIAMENLNPYWKDLIYLLIIFYFIKNKNKKEIRRLQKVISHEVYLQFIEDHLRKLE
jgi:thymidylate synthase